MCLTQNVYIIWPPLFLFKSRNLRRTSVNYISYIIFVKMPQITAFLLKFHDIFSPISLSSHCHPLSFLSEFWSSFVLFRILKIGLFIHFDTGLETCFLLVLLYGPLKPQCACLSKLSWYHRVSCYMSIVQQCFLDCEVVLWNIHLFL